jgi:hypothetical protein
MPTTARQGHKPFGVPPAFRGSTSGKYWRTSSYPRVSAYDEAASG